MSTKPIWIVGTGGHAHSLASILQANYGPITFISEERDLQAGAVCTVPESDFILSGDVNRLLFNGVGVAKGNDSRKLVAEKYESLGYEFGSAMAHSAIVSSSSAQGPGTQLFHNTFVGNRSILRDHVVLGTGSIVEHDSQIGTGTFVGPGVTICGQVHLGDWCFIGAGSVLTPKSTIPNGAFIKAGSLVTHKSEFGGNK